MNDSSYLPLVCYYSPELIATAVIYIAFQVVAVEVPRDINSKDWFEVQTLHKYVLSFFFSFSWL